MSDLVDIGPFVENTIPAALQVTFTDSAGTAINLTSAGVDTYRFVYWPVDRSTSTERTGAAVTPTTGVAKYQWVEADMVAGSYQGRLWALATNQSAMYASDTYAWVVLDDPAVPAGL